MATIDINPAYPLSGDHQTIQIENQIDYVSLEGANWLSWITNLFTVFALVLFTGAFLPMLLGQQENDLFIKSNTTVQLIYMAIYAVTVIISIPYLRQIFSSLSKIKLIMLLLLWTFASITWSYAPDVTLRRVVATVCTTYFGLFFAAAFPLRTQLKLLAWALGITVIISLIFVVFMPDQGLMHSMQHSGSWKGVFRHKNLLSRIAALAICVFVLCIYVFPKYRWLTISLGIIAATEVFYANSLGGGVIMIALLFVLFPIRSIIRRLTQSSMSLILGVLSFAFAGLLLVFQQLDAILNIVEIDMITIWGRFEIWQLVWKEITGVFWTGYGYDAFWLGWNGPARNIWIASSWSAPHSHNSILDLWIELGFIGVMIFVTAFVQACINAIKFARQSQSHIAILPVTFMTFFFASSLPESVILQSNDVYWILFISLTIGAIEGNEVLEDDLGQDSFHPVTQDYFSGNAMQRAAEM